MACIIKRLYPNCLTKEDIIEIVYLLVIGLITTMILFNPISRIADKLVPNMDVSITYEDGSWYIVNDDNENNIFYLIKEEVGENESFEYIDNSTLVSPSGEKISFTMKMRLNSYFMIYKNSSNGRIIVETNGKVIERDMSQDDEQIGSYVKIYPVANEIMPLIILFVCYLVVYMVVLFILFNALHIFRYGIGNFAIWNLENSRWVFAAVFIFFYIISMIQYRRGIPNYLEFGDQLYYWGIDIFKDGFANPVSLVEQGMVAFRGYLCNLIPSLSKTIGSILHIDPISIYFLFNSAILASLLCIILPGIYETFNDKRAKLWNVVLLIMIYMLFWQGTLTAVLVDMYAATAFFAGIYFGIRGIKQHKILSFFVSGVMCGISCNLRMAYQFGWYALAVGLLVSLFGRCRLKKENTRRNVLVIMWFIMGLLLVSIPQIRYNCYNGHFGILPYDGGLTETQSLTEVSMNISINSFYSGYPFTVTDEQLTVLDNFLYTNEDKLSVYQMLGVYLSNPINSLVYLIKKIVVAFDIKTNITYPNNIVWYGSRGFLFSFCNYFVIANSIYLIFSDKLHKNEKAMSIITFCSLVLPEMVMHVEWRYYLAMYIVFYYVFAFGFMQRKVLHSVLKEKNYCVIVPSIVLFMFLVSISVSW